MKKKINYGLARMLTTMSTVICLSQIIVEILFQRKPGFEFIVPLTVVICIATWIYAFVVVVINSKRW